MTTRKELHSGNGDPVEALRESRNTNLVTTNDSASIEIETDHIPSSHETKMLAQRIHPYVVLELRVPDTDMP